MEAKIQSILDQLNQVTKDVQDIKNHINEIVNYNSQAFDTINSKLDKLLINNENISAKKGFSFSDASNIAPHDLLAALCNKCNFKTQHSIRKIFLNNKLYQNKEDLFKNLVECTKENEINNLFQELGIPRLTSWTIDEKEQAMINTFKKLNVVEEEKEEEEKEIEKGKKKKKSKVIIKEGAIQKELNELFMNYGSDCFNCIDSHSSQGFFPFPKLPKLIKDKKVFEFTGKPDFCSIYAPMFIEIKPKGSLLLSKKLINPDYLVIYQGLERVFCTIMLNETFNFACSFAISGERSWLITASIKDIEDCSNPFIDPFKRFTFHIMSITTEQVIPIWKHFYSNHNLFFSSDYFILRELFYNFPYPFSQLSFKRIMKSNTIVYGVALSKKVGSFHGFIEGEFDLAVKITTDWEIDILNSISDLNASRYVIYTMNQNLNQQFIGLQSFSDLFEELGFEYNNLTNNRFVDYFTIPESKHKEALDNCWIKYFHDETNKTQKKSEKNRTVNNGALLMYISFGKTEYFQKEEILSFADEIYFKKNLLHGDPRFTNMLVFHNIPKSAFNEDYPFIDNETHSFLIDYDRAIKEPFKEFPLEFLKERTGALYELIKTYGQMDIKSKSKIYNREVENRILGDQMSQYTLRINPLLSNSPTVSSKPGVHIKEKSLSISPSLLIAEKDPHIDPIPPDQPLSQSILKRISKVLRLNP